MKLTENQLRKIIRASLKNNSGQQLNEAPIFALLGPALKYLGSAIAAAAAIYAGEKVLGFMIEEHRVEAVSNAINVNDIQLFLTQYVDMLAYAESCGETDMIVELTKFQNLCGTILDEITSKFSIYPNFIEALQIGVEGIVIGNTVKKAHTHYKGRNVDTNSLTGKHIKRFGKNALKKVAVIGAIMAAADIGNQLIDTNKGVKDFKEMLKNKNFKEDLKKFKNMHEEMDKGNLSCRLRDAHFSVE